MLGSRKPVPGGGGFFEPTKPAKKPRPRFTVRDTPEGRKIINITEEENGK